MIAYQAGPHAAQDVIQLIDPAQHVPKSAPPPNEQQVAAAHTGSQPAASHSRTLPQHTQQ